ncbi:hypothetical protein ES705_43558 [subsurface metagenome]
MEVLDVDHGDRGARDLRLRPGRGRGGVLETTVVADAGDVCLVEVLDVADAVIGGRDVLASSRFGSVFFDFHVADAGGVCQVGGLDFDQGPAALEIFDVDQGPAAVEVLDVDHGDRGARGPRLRPGCRGGGPRRRPWRSRRSRSSTLTRLPRWRFSTSTTAIAALEVFDVDQGPAAVEVPHVDHGDRGARGLRRRPGGRGDDGAVGGGV